MRSLSLILNDDVPEPELVERIGDDLVAWGRDNGLNLIHQPAASDGAPVRIDRWFDPDGQLMFELVRDEQLGHPYLSIVHPDKARLREVWEAMRGAPQGRSIADLKRDVARSGARDPAAYLRLAMGLAPEPDAEASDLIAEGLTSADLETRAQAAMAAGLLLWPAFESPLEAALASEPDRGVADVMTAALRFLRAER
ncbi:hypothetical protein PMI01_03220 [Caulobacter sp. AP07]|uniref:hypothetical protein n=1 Tax=Caulobacter sp. AP07 TaxID=1144304 RepID=UPI0002720712|nr:hypothetical protein [Caulobacter sp. AP07]EJL30103.1 hypothetical protein PMI01_03220 [Caulobacter sp. AP07]